MIPQRLRSPLPTSLAILFAMLVLALLIVWPILRDQRGTEVTRYRNALLAERGTAADFDWTPANWPGDFRREQAEVPNSLRNWQDVAVAQASGDWPKTLALAKALTGKPRKGNMIAKPTLLTLAIIEQTGAGYCADYTKVTNALGYSAGLQVRQWSFSFDGFGGWGHTFNEVWDNQAQRWRMIDVFNGFYPRDPADGEVMSALAFRDRLLNAPNQIIWQRIEDGRFGFADDAAALEYFRNGANEWYLWWGNDPLAYDQQPLVAFAAKFGRMPEQIAGVLTGALAGFKILANEQNSAATEAILRLKTWLLLAAVAEFLLGLALLWQLRRAWRARRAKHPTTGP